MIGYNYIHSAIDDHYRLAYSEVLPDESEETATAFWTRAHASFNRHGIHVERVLTDNGACYKSFLWRDTLTAGITHKRIRFNRTLLDEWAYLQPYTTTPNAPPHGQTAATPTTINRVNNASGQYT